MKQSINIILLLFLVHTQLAFSISDEIAISNPNQTAIQINLPNHSTVWMSPGKVKLEWDTKNIASDKTIQFYLTKDNTVVQELGIFKNSKFIENVTLERGHVSGNNYRVIGIELFPNNKFSIAKFATPFFTIKKAPRVEESTDDEIKTMEVSVYEEKPIVREKFDGRDLKYTNAIKVKNENIKINLRDHGRTDGDIVSIYLNGEAVVSKYLLTYRNKTFDIKLDPNKPNDLFLYAHNLGKTPPNTVAIEIKDGQISKKIILNSDLNSCEAIMINVEE